MLLAAGEVIDLRKASMVPMIDELQTAGIIHHMLLDLVIDPESRKIERLETEQPAVAVEASEKTLSQSCRDPAPRLQELVGHVIDADLSRELQRIFGGPLGCSHLLTLFHLMANALPGALDDEQALRQETGCGRRPSEKIFRRSVSVDGFQPDDGQLQLVVLLMDYKSRPLEAVKDRLGFLMWQREVRALANVSLAKIRIEELEIFERWRTRETLAKAEWQDRGEWVEGLVGHPIMPGLGRELRNRLGDRAEASGVLDALLQLAPGFVQCTPALTDAVLGRVAAAQEASTRRSEPAEAEERPSLPSFLALGGAADSCYMWRRDGPLFQIRPPSRESKEDGG
jgi:hypothetical protein